MFNRPLFIHRKREKKLSILQTFFRAEKCVFILQVFFFYSSAGKIIWQQWWWCGREWERKKENCNFTLNTRLSSYMNAGCISPYMFMFVCAEIFLLFFLSPFSCVWEIRHFKNSNSTAIICFFLRCVTFNCLTLWQGRKFLLYIFFYSFYFKRLEEHGNRIHSE